MLNLARLRVLREVARRGSMSAAAEALSYSQPAISHQVAKLERETGARLIERVPRGVRMTEAGELLVRHADAVLARLDRAEAELADLVALRRGRLRFGAFPTAFVALVPAALAALRSEHPGVETTLSEVGLEEAAERVEAGELDLAVAFAYDEPSLPPTVRRVPLLDDPMHLILPRNHPAADRRRLKPAHLKDEPFIQLALGPASRAVYAALAHAGFAPQVVFETDDVLAIQGLVAAGAGVSLMPGMALPTLRPELVTRSLGSAVPARKVFALIPAEGPRAPAATPMLTLLEREAARLG